MAAQLRRRLGRALTNDVTDAQGRDADDAPVVERQLDHEQIGLTRIHTAQPDVDGDGLAPTRAAQLEQAVDGPRARTIPARAHRSLPPSRAADARMFQPKQAACRARMARISGVIPYELGGRRRRAFETTIEGAPIKSEQLGGA